MSRQLKEAMNNGSTISSFLRFYVKASTQDCHTHSTTSTEICQKIHPDIAAEIKRLAEEGFTETKEVKMLLQQYVQRIFANGNSPTGMNKALFPEDNVIHAHLYRAVFTLRKKELDQEALQTLVDKWKTETDDCFLFRPYEENGEDNDTTTFLFCHQTKWQQDLLLRYGRICLLDATYKTTQYALPLFFLAVKTNVGYCVVGTFIVHTESTLLVAEALNVFKEWLPDWRAQYWMTDYSEVEIHAIEDTFQGSTVYLCAFHREQAWLWWVRKSGIVIPGDGEEILKIWRKVAASADITSYQQNVEEMKLSTVMKQNTKATQYFTSQWLQHAHRWVQAFSEKDYLTIIHTNNGLESQNKVLKHAYLCCNSDKSLTGMLKTVIEAYLPDTYKKYCYKNSKFKVLDSQIPTYLLNRPQHFIKHVLTRISSARSEFCAESITQISSGVFHVHSSLNKNVSYVVKFDEASCSCVDFMTYRFPCKHMCAIFEFIPGWSFQQLNSAYISNPYISLDASHGYCTVTDMGSCVSSECEISSNDNAVEPETSTQTNHYDVLSQSQHTSSQIKQSQQKFRDVAKMLIDMSYICNDKQVWDNATTLLLETHKEIAGKIKTSNALPLLNCTSSMASKITINRIKRKYLTLPLRRKHKNRKTNMHIGV